MVNARLEPLQSGYCDGEFDVPVLCVLVVKWIFFVLVLWWLDVPFFVLGVVFFVFGSGEICVSIVCFCCTVNFLCRKYFLGSTCWPCHVEQLFLIMLTFKCEHCSLWVYECIVLQFLFLFLYSWLIINHFLLHCIVSDNIFLHLVFVNEINQWILSLAFLPGIITYLLNGIQYFVLLYPTFLHFFYNRVLLRWHERIPLETAASCLG